MKILLNQRRESRSSAAPLESGNAHVTDFPENIVAFITLYLGYLNNEKNVVCKVLENTKLSRTKKVRGNTKMARPALAKQPNAPLLAMASESTDPSWANTGHSQIVGSNDTCSAADSTTSATATGVESFEI